MQKKFIKLLVASALAITLILCTALTAFALPINNISPSYFYNVDGNDASAPLAFSVERVITLTNIKTGDISKTAFSPSDLFFANGYLYILDSAGNRVYVLDDQYKLVSEISRLSGDIPDLPQVSSDAGTGEEGATGGATGGTSKYEFSEPRGIFVTDDGMIYVSDTQHQRIVVCDINGVVSRVYQSIRVTVLGKNYTFKPTRLVIDNTGDMQVICEGINRGIMQITSDGEFRSFFGTPDVIISLWDRVWRNFATEEQLKQMVSYTPTEYSSVGIDARGFIYPTISALDETAIRQLSKLSTATTYAPVKKLSADGTDMLRRKGLAAPMGDLVWAPSLEAYPKIVDIAVDSDSGRYTILDQQTGRFFTYDNDGNILYLCGGRGTSAGTFQLAVALEMNGDYIYVADATSKSITVFRATAYVHAINAAAEATANGLWKESIPLWQDVLSYNSNMYIANIGLGKAEMRLAMNLIDDQRDEDGLNALDHYERAIVYFDRANEKVNYSTAYMALRTNEMEKYFGLILGAIFVLVVGLYVFVLVRKHIKKKKMKPVFRPSDREAPVINRMKKKGDEE